MKIANILTAQKPNWLNILFWLTDYIDNQWIVVKQPTYFGSIELNNITLVSNMEPSTEGFYAFKIKVHSSKFNGLATGGIGKVRLIIGSISNILENPTMPILKQTDKVIDESSVLEISQQQGWWNQYPWNQNDHPKADAYL